MRFALTAAATVTLFFVGGAAVTFATHSNSEEPPRPAHLAQSTAHTSNVPAGANEAWPAMQNAYDYWNLAASIRPLNGYQNPVAQVPVVKYDLIVDFVTQGGLSCIYDLLHCQSVTSEGYATITRWDDLNVGHVVWNATLYSQVGNPTIDGQPFRVVAARHELGHDQYLGDHLTSYDGLMCNSDTCTRRSAATTAELDAASGYFQSRPVPASTISIGAVTSSSVVINFSGAANADSLVPFRANTFLANWVGLTPIASSATSYTFTGLAATTTYQFRIASRKAGQPDATSQWVTATTAALNRPANFTINASGSTSVSLTWSSVAYATSYQYCYAAGPNDAPGSWTCSSTTNTSASGSIPSTSTKTVRYYAVRAVDAGGNVSKFSNRGSVSRINETVGGNSYKSYHTLYKDAAGVKKVNARNKQAAGGATHWLGYNNGSVNKYGAVAANSNWFTSPSSWNVSDQSTPYGPVVLAFDAISSILWVQDSIFHSTVCMVIEPACN